MHWYEVTAKKILEETDLITWVKALGYFAVTSANASVKGNFTLMHKALVQDPNFSGFLPRVIDNLLRVKNDKLPSGLKIQEFYKALLGNAEAVVIDRWILRAYGFKHLTKKRKAIITKDITKRALLEGVEPRQYQAAIWTAIRGGE